MHAHTRLYLNKHLPHKVLPRFRAPSFKMTATHAITITKAAFYNATLMENVWNACLLPRSRITPHLNIKCRGFLGPDGCHVDYLDGSPWRGDVIQTRRNVSSFFCGIISFKDFLLILIFLKILLVSTSYISDEKVISWTWKISGCYCVPLFGIGMLMAAICR